MLCKRCRIVSAILAPHELAYQFGGKRKSHYCMISLKGIKSGIRKFILRAVPLPVRKVVAIWINRQPYLDARRRTSMAEQLLEDFSQTDTEAYHRFMWRNHLGYAKNYVVGKRFGVENLHETRREFFAELLRQCEGARLSPAKDFVSVLELGCSLGYLLRFMETDIFPAAVRLEGIDIDERAVEEGMRHLRKVGSRVNLQQGDLACLDIMLVGAKFDFILASGVLLYFNEASATEIVSSMLSHANKMVAFTALAHPEVDNRDLTRSVPRERDSTWIHNVDKMVVDAGGTISGRRWDGDRVVDENTFYFVFAVPGN